MSAEVTGRFSGSPNMIPSFRWNVYVMPSEDTSGMSVAMSGTRLLPVSPPVCGYVSSVRPSRLENTPNAMPRYSPVGSPPLVQAMPSVSMR